MTQENLNILVKLRSEGMQLLDQLIQGMEQAGLESSEFRNKADTLNSELQQLAQQQELINQFRDQKDAVALAAVAYEKAQEKAQKLEAHISRLGVPAKQQADAFIKAGDAVKNAGLAYDKAKNKLQGLEKTLTSTGVKSKELVAENQRIKTGIDRTSAAIAKLTQEARKAANAQKAFSTLGVRSAKEIEAEITRVRTAMQTLKNTSGITGAALKQSMRAGELQVKKLERELRGVNGQLRITDRVANAMGGTIGQVFGGNLLANGAQRLIAAIQDMGREFITANIQAQRLHKSLDAIYKDSQTTSSQIAFLRKTSTDAGVAFSGLTDQFISFSAATKAANISLEVSNEVFASVIKAGATLGLSTDRVNNALLALGQMASKGVVAMEELRQQLGDALPGALGLVAEGLGVSDQQLIKLVESGGLAARDMLPALGQALKDLHGDTDTITGAWDRFKNAMTEAFQGVGEGGGIDVLTFSVKALAGALGVVLVPLHAFVEAVFLVARAVGGAAAAIDIMLDRSVTWKEKIKLLSDITKDLGDKAAEAGGRIDNTTNAFLRATGITDTHTKSTSKAAQAAAEFSKEMVSLGVKSAETAKEQQQNIKNFDKLAQAAKAEGQTLVRLARIRGDAAAVAKAEAQAAQKSAQAAKQAAQTRVQLLQTYQNELAAKLKLLESNPQEAQAREAEIKSIQSKITAQQAVVEASQQTAAAVAMEAAQRAIAAKSYQDNAAAVDELRDSMQAAQAALENQIELEAMGLITKEQLTATQIKASQATALYRDALDDLAKLQQAKTELDKQSLSLERATLMVGLERAKNDERKAKRMGDEEAMHRAIIKQKDIQIQIAKLEIELDNAKADAAIAVAKAKMAELEAGGKLTSEQRLVIEAQIKSAEVQKELNRARAEAVKGMEEERKALAEGNNELDKRIDKINKTSSAIKNMHNVSNAEGTGKGTGAGAKYTIIGGDDERSYGKEKSTFATASGSPQREFSAEERATSRVYKIKLGSAGTVYTDAAGAQTVDRLMRQLEQGKAATGRNL